MTPRVTPRISALRFRPRFARPSLWLVATMCLGIGTGAAQSAQAARPTADSLVEQAWLFLPEYDGEHRSFLSAAGQSDTRAAIHLLGAALCLEPEHTRGLWSLGHASILLAEDRRNRGLAEEAGQLTRDAVASLGRAIELQPDDPWAWYARGTARSAAGEQDAALVDLERARELVEARIEAGEAHLDWLRYKILGWRAEVQLRAGRFEDARRSFEAYHGEFSTNDWPLQIALAESHLRERDWLGARERYLEILTRFAADHQAYALLGYVAGLLGESELASRRLEEAIARELQPGVYTRLWLFLLATEERRPAAAADLASFLENPPPGPTEWDLALGRFVLGGESVADFTARLEAELQRRMDAGEPLDDLECEGWFYIGVRHELDAAAGASEDGAADAGLARALEAHRRALRQAPVGWKWEWAFARLHLARLAQGLGRGPATRLVNGARSASLEELTSSLDGVRWHAPLEGASTAHLGRDPRPGDLLLGRRSGTDGPSGAVLWWVDAE